MSSWDDLKLKEDESIYLKGSLNKYYKRVGEKYSHIPEEVFEQWIIPLHQDIHTLKNYSWINFEKATISVRFFSVEDLLNLNVIQDFTDLVVSRAKSRVFDSFACIKEDLEFWKTKKTWKTPPIIIDSKSFSDKPKDSEISGEYQLIEGHNRLGYLYAINNSSKDILNEKHKVYLLSNAKK